MIFCVCEHYYYDDEQYNECFICFEYITDKSVLCLYKLRQSKFYLK